MLALREIGWRDYARGRSATERTVPIAPLILIQMRDKSTPNKLLDTINKRTKNDIYIFWILYTRLSCCSHIESEFRRIPLRSLAVTNHKWRVLVGAVCVRIKHVAESLFSDSILVPPARARAQLDTILKKSPVSSRLYTCQGIYIDIICTNRRRSSLSVKIGAGPALPWKECSLRPSWALKERSQSS